MGFRRVDQGKYFDIFYYCLLMVSRCRERVRTGTQAYRTTLPPSESFAPIFSLITHPLPQLFNQSRVRHVAPQACPRSVALYAPRTWLNNSVSSIRHGWHSHYGASVPVILGYKLELQQIGGYGRLLLLNSPHLLLPSSFLLKTSSSLWFECVYYENMVYHKYKCSLQPSLYNRGFISYYNVSIM
jgi:hypothetical protein